MLDLNELSKICFVTEYQKYKLEYDLTSQLLKDSASELIRATEGYVYYKKADPFCRDGDEVGDTRKYFANELANVIVSILAIAGKENIDIEKALLYRIDKKQEK